jgi:hypothetical protein
MTKCLRPSSAPGEGSWIGMGIAYPVSVFAPELSGWSSVLTLVLGLVRRRSLPRSFLSPSALVIPPFRRCPRPKEGSLVCLSSSPLSRIMAIAPLSLPPFSHFHHSSSPLANPLLQPNAFSTRKSNIVLSIPHLSRMSPAWSSFDSFICKRSSY